MCVSECMCVCLCEHSFKTVLHCAGILYILSCESSCQKYLNRIFRASPRNKKKGLKIILFSIKTLEKID